MTACLALCYLAANSIVYLLDDEKPPEYDMDSEDESYLAGLNKKPECAK